MKILTVKRVRGFTLVEAIVVMVLTGILAGIMVLFIRNPVNSYVDTAARAELTDVADIALRRMTREIRTAVPNSIRLNIVGNTSFLEFIPSHAGGRYLAKEDGAAPVSPPGAQQHQWLDFTNAATQFEVVGPMPPAPYAIVRGDFIIISNFGTGFTNGDAYALNANNRAVVGQVNNKVITLTNNPFASVTPPASNRFIVAGQPVTFACTNDPVTGRGQLRRFSNYDFPPNQVDPGTLNLLGQSTPQQVQMTLMADNVVGCNFSVVAMANRQAALVGLGIALARAKPGAAANDLETVTLAQQIHVDNTP
ncbi:PulJ/GspJ family protein [Duganella levis]|uniref:Prepilin-type cleavage/methylation domain-containing protein n=1 Tax=Duganella levis TaxID=2692169 RepID=A0ABW9W7Z2_9BURK|nr:type II secretion system protein [Duganella levis]MYN30031.1 prepilin-type cleavage/methylation domain-containing protein [Duganella levis]